MEKQFLGNVFHYWALFEDDRNSEFVRHNIPDKRVFVSELLNCVCCLCNSVDSFAKLLNYFSSFFT